MTTNYNCCNKQSIVNFDHKKPAQDNEAGYIEIENRVCIRCLEHWYGEVGNVKQYTRKAWDEMINGAFDKETKK